jgi:outer membrane murein-binding lipoprotein Lpp
LRCSNAARCAWLKAFESYFRAECKLSPTPDIGKKAVAEAWVVMVKLGTRADEAVCLALKLVDYSTDFSEGDLNMKNSLGMTIAAVAAFAALAGCTDLKPLQADIDSLKTQVGTLSSDVAAMKADRTAANAASSASAAAASATAASAKADAAQNTANQALSAAQAAQTGVNDVNVKIDRMFQRSVSK